eukprot:2672207-Rhodomonas_salina.1
MIASGSSTPGFVSAVRVCGSEPVCMRTRVCIVRVQGVDHVVWPAALDMSMGCFNASGQAEIIHIRNHIPGTNCTEKSAIASVDRLLLASLASLQPPRETPVLTGARLLDLKRHAAATAFKPSNRQTVEGHSGLPRAMIQKGRRQSGMSPRGTNRRS